MAVVELRQGTSPEEFLYVVRVLRRREAAVMEMAHSARIDAAEQTVEVRLRLVKPVFETPRPLSYQLDLSLPQIAKIDLRLRPFSPSFEGPRQISLQLEYGVPPVKPLAASLKPITVFPRGPPDAARPFL
jgi:acetolactate synthase regulatory subunit